jgi:hypothetical protein
MEAHMRFTKTACVSAVTLASALSAAPALAAPAGPLPVWDRPACRPGEQAVWVDRLATPGRIVVGLHGEKTYIPGEQELHGWECQPIRLLPV